MELSAEVAKSWRLFGDFEFFGNSKKWAKYLKYLARPEGFEPPTLRSEERLRHRLTRTHVEKKSETQAINAVSDLRHGLYSLPVPHSPVATW
jgi:hypothetical protein